MKKVCVIGSGFSSLASACYLAKSGFEVKVVEKNATLGGRARRLEKDGFTFDMGPTWYWMPDVFERFFNDFGKSASDYYSLSKLNPAYSVYFDRNDKIDIDDSLEKIKTVFESEEKGAGVILQQFIDEAQSNYDIAIKDLVYRPGESIFELITPKTVFKVGQFFSNISSDVRKKFKSQKLRQILEFPVLFLGAKPSNTPSFYNFMNFADFGLGTWHPNKGMFAVVEAMVSLAKELGVSFETNASVTSILIENNKVVGIEFNGKKELADVVLSGADYAHTETLLPQSERQYSDDYWKKKTFAPSALLFYVGFTKKLKNINHHTLFFDAPFEQHAQEIYDEPQWPKNPLFYASFPSVTESFFAPEGKESGIFLIPLATDLKDTPQMRDLYFEKIISRFERITNQEVKNSIQFKESFCLNDFKSDYNSCRGNAYGLANTLMQTAFLRPNIRSRKVIGLFFTGQLTVPGPGVPPALISGKIASELISKHFK